MSLLAKLEAVIYAAEEPVTLAQLTALFADEALELKAAEAGESLEESEQSPQLAYAAEPEIPAEPPAPAATEEQAELDQPETPAADESESAESVETAEEPLDIAAEEKRLARQREREARAIVRGLLDQLIAQYASDDRGLEVREIAGGYRMATKPACHDAVVNFVKSLKPALKLSLPALETLAVIAYKQPVTAPEVNEIRGVESSGVFGSLLSRKLIATAGRKQVIGRPILYKTTREFLMRFGLKDLSELPSMEEFEKLAALELDEPESPAERSGELFAQASQEAAGVASGAARNTDAADEPAAVPTEAVQPSSMEDDPAAATTESVEATERTEATSEEEFAAPASLAHE